MLKQPSSYSQERVQNDRLIDAIEDSNDIAREQLELDQENSSDEWMNE